jgi:aspartyl-tRNA(Asn)/glutamyl-tRNA(Gln) amidotransferase subunit A
LISADYARAFENVDVIMGPTTPDTAFEFGAKSEDPTTMYLCDIYTNGVNLAGLPGMSIPAGFSADLPVGLHLVGNYFDEGLLLRVADAYQRATDWHKAIPESYQ